MGKAVLLQAMHHMKAAGMTHATVANAGTNEASRELYKACGFEPRHLIDDYVKRIPVRRDGPGA
ncbi:GNAT family N-acetyltransferase [Candidatus Bipolaricaulota bacterium]|nr:GNAT family N-acetyltransferase [Candidatus Bipolaricaulota bacterium]